jgi:hypothetical protein
MLSVGGTFGMGRFVGRKPPCPAFYSVLPLFFIIRLPVSECNDFLSVFPVFPRLAENKGYRPHGRHFAPPQIVRENNIDAGGRGVPESVN